jgi:hypothetical protein
MPAANSASINTGSRDAGPSVARILAFLTVTPLSIKQETESRRQKSEAKKICQSGS